MSMTEITTNTTLTGIHIAAFKIRLYPPYDTKDDTVPALFQGKILVQTEGTVIYVFHATEVRYVDDSREYILVETAFPVIVTDIKNTYRHAIPIS